MLCPARWSMYGVTDSLKHLLIFAFYRDCTTLPTKVRWQPSQDSGLRSTCGDPEREKLEP